MQLPTRASTSASSTDVDRMVDRLLFEGPEATRKRSAFWVLLTLAAVIATAGVSSDSTATVIGAMIVAPLMTPILGVALSVVLARRASMWRCARFVVGGVLVVVSVGYLFAIVAPFDGVGVVNTQVDARIHPRLIDLVAALATGTVGAFALVRSDVSDTLPGVAIAISLVPPLSVVGLLLEAGRYGDAGGAFLLFATNATAIIATGILVLLLARVRDAAAESGTAVGRLSGRTLLAVAAMTVVLTVPLAFGTLQIVQARLAELAAEPVATAWAEEQGWRVVSLQVRDGTVRLVALGPPPELDPSTLRAALDDAGVDLDLVIDLVVGGTRELPAGAG
jgi:uncharacterized hydrophobic protein (TIGR00271 family)